MCHGIGEDFIPLNDSLNYGLGRTLGRGVTLLDKLIEAAAEKIDMEEDRVEQFHHRLATLGSNVLLDLNDGDRFIFIRLHPSSTIKIGNTRCSVSPLIDSPYGSTFELQRGPDGPLLVKVPSPRFSQHDNNASPADRDNRNLIDDNSAQKLSAEDIERLRMEGVFGKDIVDALVANSATFHTKTAYSQEKYKKKKQKKYAPHFVLRRPSARRICEAYFSKTPQKIGCMRMDTLSLILSFANVGAHAEVLVMDMTGGLVTAAVAERIGGFGSVCNVYYTKKPPPMDIVGLLNLRDSMANRVFRTSIQDLLAALTSELQRCRSGGVSCDGGAHNKENNNDVEDKNTHDMELNIVESDDLQMPIDSVIPHVGNEDNEVENGGDGPESMLLNENRDDASSSQDNIGSDNGKCHTKINVQQGRKKPNESALFGRCPSSGDISRWAKHGFNSLIVAALEVDPYSAIHEFLPFLSPSSPFVIYHRYLQPLAQCMHGFQTSKTAIALEIVEPWLREYQVLPSRTHPHMQMNATGGYLLTGIKLVPQ